MLERALGLQFLKLGGSLITEKSSPHTPRPAALKRLAQEIASGLAAARRLDPNARLLLGHGSGSFGHVPARQYGTRQGVRTAEGWQGFVEVWREAAALNRLVMDALREEGLPALAFPPSACVTAKNGRAEAWDLTPVRLALEAGLLPVVFGDVAFDTALGGTILSTEDLFAHLAPQLLPQRVLIAGLEPGVWADFPACTRLVKVITPSSFPEVEPSLGGSVATDVTGGMASKVRQSLALAQSVPGLEVLIFSGEQDGNLNQALTGESLGTSIRVEG